MISRMKLPPITFIDVVALVGLVLCAIGVGLLFEPAAALVFVGAVLLVYAVAVAAGTAQ